MPIDECARVAVQLWPRDLAIMMVAIAGCESAGYNARAEGDSVWSFPPDQQPIYDLYDCGGYTSFGYWQINTRWNYNKLQTATGSTDPCVWRDYLFVPANNAYIADLVYREGGWSRWSCYNNLGYRAYHHDARVAVDLALEEIAPPIPPLPPPWPPPPGPGPALLYVAPVAPPSPSVGDFRFLPPVPPPAWS